MEFLEKNGKSILITILLVLSIGFVITWMTGKSQSQEAQAQAEYSKIEEQFTQYQQSLKPATSPTEKTISVDVNELKKSLETFSEKNKGTVAAQMAALSLAEILVKDGQIQQAVTVLQHQETSSGLLSNTLLRKRLGQLQADLDQCPEAIKTWDKILNDKKAIFAHGNTRIQQALCYQKMKDFKKAEDLLNLVKAQKTSEDEPETNQARQEAEKLLRLMKFSQDSGT